MPDETYGVEEAARMIGVKSRKTAYKRVDDGTIPTIRVGRKLRVPAAEFREKFHLERKESE